MQSATSRLHNAFSRGNLVAEAPEQLSRCASDAVDEGQCPKLCNAAAAAGKVAMHMLVAASSHRQCFGHYLRHHARQAGYGEPHEPGSSGPRRASAVLRAAGPWQPSVLHNKLWCATPAESVCAVPPTVSVLRRQQTGREQCQCLHTPGSIVDSLPGLCSQANRSTAPTTH